MRKAKLWMLAAPLLAFPAAAGAQGVPVLPRFALFGGATVATSDCLVPLPEGCNPVEQTAGGTTFHQVGWGASGEFDPLHSRAVALGIVGDVSEQYPQGNIETNQVTALFGPQLSTHVIPRVVPFAHVLFGVAHGQTTAAGAVTGLAQPATASVFAAALGGGVDVKIFGALWFRVVQADYLHANFAPDHRTRFRISTGLVLRFP